MKHNKARLFWSEGICRLISQTERSIQVKTASKIHAAHHQKNLNGLYDGLVPERTFRKAISVTSIIKDPTNPKYVFATWILPISARSTGATRNCVSVEQKVNNHKKDVLRKDGGSKK